MFLKSLTIENCRSLAFAELEFDARGTPDAIRKWSMLVGENGTGKSTVLKAIALLLGGSDALPHLLGSARSWVRNGTEECRIRAVLVTKSGEERRIGLSFKADQPIREIISANTIDLAPIDNALGHAEQNYFVVAYGPYRHIADEMSPFKTRSSEGAQRIDGIRTLFVRNAPVKPLSSWAMGLEYKQGSEGLDIVREAMNALLPGLEFIGIDRQRGALMFNTPDGPVDLSELSDGYQNVAAWIGDLLYRVTESFSHYRDPLMARGLLLIDEIDAHLHPTWQRNLKGFLDSRLPNFQIVATTHSALTLQQFRQEEAFLLRRSSGLVELASFPTDPNLLRLHQLYDLAFRVGTLDSVEVEASKAALRSVQDTVGSSASSETTFARDVVARATANRTAVDDALGNEALEGLFSRLERVASGLEQRSRDTTQQRAAAASRSQDISRDEQ